MPFAVITGASDGIGKALAIELARRGYSLGLIARRKEKLEEVAAACRNAASGVRALASSVDVTQSVELRRALGEWWDSEKGIDLFVANAGLAIDTHETKDSFDDIERMIHVNVIAALSGLEFLKPKMIERGRGTLVGMGSVAGARGMPKTSGYSATKAALHAYLDGLRMDVRKHGVDVCEIAPGYIDTAMTKPNRFHMPFLMQPEVAARKMADRILKKKKFTVLPWPYRWAYPLLRNAPGRLVEFVMKDGA